MLFYNDSRRGEMPLYRAAAEVYNGVGFEGNALAVGVFSLDIFVKFVARH